LIYIPHQKPFSNSTFEADNYRELTGIITQSPAPMLQVRQKDGSLRGFLLVDEGKIGAREFLADLQKKIGDKLENYEVTLRSELIYYDGKTLLEVPSSENKSVKYKKLVNPVPELPKPSLGLVKLKGEIIDPKCYFGAMNPCFGKIHRSCAVRCISGGIPPVLLIRNPKGTSQYFILSDSEGKDINQAVLPYIGHPIEVEGELAQMHDWLILKLNTTKTRKLATASSGIESVYEISE
jgi:hypothetical protein